MIIIILITDWSHGHFAGGLRLVLPNFAYHEYDDGYFTELPFRLVKKAFNLCI